MGESAPAFAEKLRRLKEAECLGAGGSVGVSARPCLSLPFVADLGMGYFAGQRGGDLAHCNPNCVCDGKLPLYAAVNVENYGL